MTNADQKLDASLVWDPAGHLGEIALTALADGERELLPDQAVVHAASCRLCEERLGSAALLAVEIAGAMRVVRRSSLSTYVHLALGCAIYVVLSSLPFVGHFVTAAVALIGFGTLVATRGAGLIKLRRAGGAG